MTANSTDAIRRRYTNTAATRMAPASCAGRHHDGVPPWWTPSRFSTDPWVTAIRNDMACRVPGAARTNGSHATTTTTDQATRARSSAGRGSTNSITTNGIAHGFESTARARATAAATP